MGERQFETYVKYTVITLNTYLQGLPPHHQCRGYVQIYMYICIYMCVCVCVCVQDSETDNCGNKHITGGGNKHITGG